MLLSVHGVGAEVRDVGVVNGEGMFRCRGLALV